jgi:predicted nucleic acid-binding protein
MSAKRITLDSNLLVYAFDHAEGAKRVQAEQILAAAAAVDCPLALQAVGEFFNASVRRKILDSARAAEQVNRFLDIFETFADNETAHRDAAEAAAKGRFSYWDAVLLSSASQQGCEIILSKDMHDGAKLGNIAVRNPFGAKGLSDAAKEALGV